jgi:hypothetical protein
MMKRLQFDEAVRAHWKRQPFRPFFIEYDDGQRFIVTDPTRFGCYAGSATLFYPDDSLDVIDYENVVRIAELADSNGG